MAQLFVLYMGRQQLFDHFLHVVTCAHDFLIVFDDKRASTKVRGWAYLLP